MPCLDWQKKTQEFENLKWLVMRRVLKYGNTTGVYATAAAKAALITLLDKPVDHVGIPSPLGIRFELLITECMKLSDDTAVAYAIKNAGEDIDVTDKMKISATVKLTDDGEVNIMGGKGVGTVTKPGLPVPVGEAAINPTPRKMIEEAIREVRVRPFCLLGLSRVDELACSWYFFRQSSSLSYARYDFH
jgi:cobalamin biosynthesis protein CbiD